MAPLLAMVFEAAVDAEYQGAPLHWALPRE